MEDTQINGNQISQEKILEAIRRFETILAEIEATDIAGDDRVKKELIHAVAEILGINVSADHQDDVLSNIFSLITTPNQKRWAAICLLRLLPCRAAGWLTEGLIRPKVVQLIESQFDDDLYKNRNEMSNLQNHEKIDRMIGVIREVKVNLKKAIDLFTNLDTVKVHRQRMMSVLNAKSGRILLQPFLPDNIESLLSDFYNRIEEYNRSKNGTNIVEARRKVNEDADRIEDVLASHGTRCSQLLRNEIVKRARTLLEQDFSSNEAAQPTVVVLKPKNKKYPLHTKNAKIQIGFLVENQGPGYAHDIRITVVGDGGISLQEDDIEVGRLSPGTFHSVEIPALVETQVEKTCLYAEVIWKDFDGTSHVRQFDLIVDAQRKDVNWETLSCSDPYSLEPVISEYELVGRKDMLNRLIGAAQARSVGSAIICGQKRVGKTSIARALESHLKRLGYIVVYLEGGDYAEPNSTATICRLGDQLCKTISFCEQRATHVPIPIFNEALSPIVEYLNEVLRVIPEIKIFFILDEFDELPIDLYMRGAVGDAFFLTLRSISSRQRVGFVVVGSEKMAHVLDCQGDKLNKWNVFQVDYFTREMDWTDYCDLIRRPVMDELDYTESSLIALHDATSGNPYFTKLICQQILSTAVHRRDNYITEEEVSRAIEDTCNKIGKNSFQHFWEDGIFESGPLATDKSVRRRKILIALSDNLRNKEVASENEITQHALCKDIHTVSADLAEFVARKILIERSKGYAFKVPFFSYWLKRQGIYDLIATFPDLDAALQDRQAEEVQRIKPDEVLSLTQKWKTYKGQAITEDKVRAWLEQFGGPKEQRCMLKLLEGLRFYGTDVIRVRMAEAHTIVKRDIIWEVATGKSGKEAKRSDILISYLDGPAKSGAFLARIYADEARVYADNVVERKALLDVISNSTTIKALVFVDDLVGTGQSASDYLKSADTELGSILNAQRIKCYFITAVAYVDGWKKVEEITKELKMKLEAHACEILENSTRCFSDSSEIYQDGTDRDYAKRLAILYGSQLVKRNPLGFGDLELAVVFERGCPNNTLPILWEDSGKPKWIPLFKRK